jgi:uncharacterized protein (TIGR02265 family)
MMSQADFVEPPWGAPLDPDAVIAEIHGDATISGMFIAPLLDVAAAVGAKLPSARDRYVSFKFYPVREHAQLLVEACRARYPRLPLREGLRRLGRGGPNALLSSTLGKVVLGSVEGVESSLHAMAKAYPLNARPCSVTVVECGSSYALLRLEQVHWFLDSHHVGTFEGVLRYAGVQGSVKIRTRGPGSADFLIEWAG